MKAFYAEVPNLVTAKLMLNTLADYDIFQFENNIKPNYCNAGGLQEFTEDEWMDWCDEETGDGIDDLTLEQAGAIDNHVKLVWNE
jgi:hypothetical protein